MPHIYVAEDDPDVRSSIAEILSDEGYEVREFSTLDEVMMELRRGARPCVVLMDFFLPGMSGQEFLDEMRADLGLSDIPLVMITGAKTEATEIEVLRKPFDVVDLVVAVSRYCGHAKARERGVYSEADPEKAGSPAS
jgi:CheY-like chemotaxis protein